MRHSGWAAFLKTVARSDHSGSPGSQALPRSPLIWLIAHSGLFVLAGWIVFVLCERAAKRQGSLGQY